MDRDAMARQLAASLDLFAEWSGALGATASDPTLDVPDARVGAVLDELRARLRGDYPFFHPRYAGQMLKPPHPVALLAYATAMQLNPNNHALDGGMATSRMEREVVADLARMLGYGAEHLGHLTAGGTIANLEALWVARSLAPGLAIAASEAAHYTHARACQLLGLDLVSIPTDDRGRMAPAALERALAERHVGTVIATLGTTALGAVDPLPEILRLARPAGARVHVDAAYGGFFALPARAPVPTIDPAPFLAIAESDSVVVDPHKHGLQPYGCGSVLFRDPAVGRFYVHDSPYTYFTSDELHLGEISLECSRAGASAAALWATLQCLPLEPAAGLGAILARTRAAALAWADLLRASDRFRLVTEPELDIIAFYPLPSTPGPAPSSGGPLPSSDESVPATPGPIRASAISALTDRLFRAAMDDPTRPVYLAKLVVSRGLLAARDPSIVWDTSTVTVLRSVLMKPEHLDAVPMLHAAVERHAAALLAP